MNRKSFFSALFASVGLAPLAKGQGAPETKWGVGRLVFARWTQGKPFPPFQHVVDETGKRVERSADHWDIRLDETVEIGLRADGVLVWRKVEPKP